MNILRVPLFLLSLCTISCHFSEEKLDEKTFVNAQVKERELIRETLQRDLRPLLESTQKMNHVFNLVAEHLDQSDYPIDPQVQSFMHQRGLELIWQETLNMTVSPFGLNQGGFEILFPIQLTLDSSHRILNFQVSVTGIFGQEVIDQYSMNFIHKGLTYPILNRIGGKAHFNLEAFLFFVHQIVFNGEIRDRPLRRDFADLNISLEINPTDNKLLLTKTYPQINHSIPFFADDVFLVVNELFLIFKLDHFKWSETNQIKLSIIKSREEKELIKANQDGLLFFYQDKDLGLKAMIPWNELFR